MLSVNFTVIFYKEEIKLYISMIYHHYMTTTELSIGWIACCLLESLGILSFGVSVRCMSQYWEGHGQGLEVEV